MINIKYFITLLIITISADYSYSQDEKIPVTLRNLRSLRNYVMSKEDSILLKEIENSFASKQYQKLENIPHLLNGCDIPNMAKSQIVDILLNKSDTIDIALFNVIGEVLFLTLHNYPIKNAKTRFVILDQIIQKKNVNEFIKYIIEKNLLNKCALYLETCSNPRNEADNFTQSEIFLTTISNLFYSEIGLLEKISNDTENFCTRYNYLRIIDIIKSKK
jgi:hypothetical protein